MTNRIVFTFAVLLGIVATVIPAVYSGTRTFRWGDNSYATRLGERLQQLPEKIGSWQFVEEQGLSLEETRQLQPIGYIGRRYTSGELSASVFAVIGPTGPIAAHTPDICFDSSSFRILGERRKAKLGQSALDNSECWLSRFESRNVQKQAVKTWYAWMVDKTWEASENPRFSFSDSPYLIKLQVAIFYPDLESMEQDKHGEEFIKDLRQSLNSTLFQ